MDAPRPVPQAPSLQLPAFERPLVPIPKVPTSTRPVPEAPSNRLSPGPERSTLDGESPPVPKATSARPAPMPSLAAFVKEGAPQADSTGSRSSPWAQSKAGGAALSQGPLDPFQDEPTIAEVPNFPARPNPPRNPASAVDSQPQISRVGFTGAQPQKAQARTPLEPDKRGPFADERSDTDEVAIEELLGKAKSDRPWEEIIDAAAGPAKERFEKPRPQAPGPSQITQMPKAFRPNPPAASAPDTAPRVPKVPTSPVQTPRGETTRQKVQAPTSGTVRPRPKMPLDPAATPPNPPRPEELIANRPVNAEAMPTDARRGDFGRLGDMDTPAVPASLGGVGRGRADLVRERNPEDTRLAAPGELAGPVPSGKSPDRTLPAVRARQGQAGETVAAPGELAGLLKPAATPSPSSRESGRTFAAPGELAGLVADLEKPPTHQKVTVAMKPTAERDILAHAAMPQPLDSSLPARSRTEQEGTPVPAPRAAHKAAYQVQKPFDDDPLRPSIEPQMVRPSAPDQSLDDGMISMPGSALPPSDTLPPLRKAEELLTGLPVAEARAETAMPIEPAISLELASGKKRLIALLIDLAVITIPIFIPMMLGLFGPAFRAISYVDPDDVSGLLITGAYKKPLVAFFVVMVVFSAVSHAVAGRTIGKLAMGLELVATRTGERPKPVRAVVRAVFSLISVLMMGAGYFWLIVDRRSRAIHDWLTGTAVVVSSSRARAD